MVKKKKFKKYAFEAGKHSNPYDSFDLNAYYFVINDETKELLIFEKHTPSKQQQLMKKLREQKC